MMTEPENSLQLGIAAYKAGEKGKARSYFLKAVRERPESEQVWGWLSNTAANHEERIHCLRQVVRINPDNKSAEKLLKELESNEWLKAGPPVSSPTTAPRISAAPVSTGTPNPAVRAPAGSDTIQTVIIILLIVLVLFWLGVGFLQLAFAFDSPNTFDLLCFGGLNIVFSILSGFLIAPVARRKINALSWLYLLAGLGFLGGAIQILFQSAYLQACATPLYVLLGILAYINREAFVN